MSYFLLQKALIVALCHPNGLVFQESSNGPVKKSMREKAIERRSINKEHNSNFKAGYVPIEEERLHKTGLRGRKGNMAVCIIVLLFLLALINLIVSLNVLVYTSFFYFLF